MMTVAQRQSFLFYFRASESKRCTATSGSQPIRPPPRGGVGWTLVLVVSRARFSLPAVVFRYPTVDEESGSNEGNGCHTFHTASLDINAMCPACSVD